MSNYVESRVTPVEKNAEETGQNLVSTANSVVDAAARNPLPIIETAVLLSLDVPPQVASAAVSAANGGKPQDIAAAYAGGQVAGAVGPTGDSITSAAGRGAVQGATSAALTGKDVAKGAVSGGATGGVTAGLTQGYKSLLDQSSSGGGLNVKPNVIPTGGDPYSANYVAPAAPTDPYGTGSTGYGLAAPTGSDTSGLSATPSTSGYLLAEPTQGQGLSRDVNNTAPQGPQLSNTEKMLAGYVAQDIVRQAGLADTSGTTSTPAAQPAATSATSNVALGSQASPTATTGADVAALDTTTGEGLGSKEGKKGGKYPWGDPEGTTALKQEGQVI
jgi:hypothetical protein